MDDDDRRPPLLFANRLIRMMVDHAGSEDMIILPDDYTVIRLLFRRAKGSWEKVSLGDVHHTRTLHTIVTAWSKMPERKRRTEMT